MSARTVGDLLGLPSVTYTAIENGYGTDRLELALLVRLARALGVSLDQLVVDPAGETEQAADGDAAALGALLHAAGVAVPSGTICEVLGWDFDRLHAAAGVLESGLVGCGLALRRTNARLSIVRGETIDSTALKAAIRRQLGREHVSVAEARMVRRIEASTAPQAPSNPETVTLGVLVNAGLVAFGEQRTRQTEAPMVLADDVRYSLFLEERDAGS
jgi:transcriptional regulator with XRE-family HTH domain